MNEELAKCFYQYAELLEATGGPKPKKAQPPQALHFRIKNYINAAETLRQLSVPISKIIEEKRKLPGIGKGLTEKIEIYLRDGKCTFLEELEKELEGKYDPKKLEALKLFLAINGIGPATASKLVNEHHIYSIEQLKNHQEFLTSTQKKGLKYYEDSFLRIPRGEMFLHKTFINTSLRESGIIQPLENIEITGSFRRGKPTSGDIDVLVSTSRDTEIVLNGIYNQLTIGSNYIVALIGKRNQKMLAYVQIPGYPVRRLDVFVTDQQEYPFSLMHWTGSKDFNIDIRKLALSQGLTLSEHGLFTVDTHQSIPARTERDIFTALNLPYIEPSKREKGIISKVKNSSLEETIITTYDENTMPTLRMKNCFEDLLLEFPNKMWTEIEKSVVETAEKNDKPFFKKVLLSHIFSIYTDGSKKPDGTGGAVIVYNYDETEEIHTISGGWKPHQEITCVYAEMYAVYKALQWLSTQIKFSTKIRTDSEFVYNTLKGIAYLGNMIMYGDSWIGSWKKKGWKKNDGKPPKNLELWKKIDDELVELLKKGNQINILWIKAHSISKGNNRADELAKQAGSKHIPW